MLPQQCSGNKLSYNPVCLFNQKALCVLLLSVYLLREECSRCRPYTVGLYEETILWCETSIGNFHFKQKMDNACPKTEMISSFLKYLLFLFISKVGLHH